MTDPTPKRYWTTDPFFERPFSSQWNALIGDQGDPENYVDGYIEAALELTEAVLVKRQFAKRDTLILPILYNIRHGVELTLKFLITNLQALGVDITPRSRDHNITEDYGLLVATNVGDEMLRSLISDLAPYVRSLAAIDDDGQMLRYAETQDGKRSLAGRNHANLLLVHTSVKELAGLLSRLRYRAIDLRDERSTGSFTQDCSRRDLAEIAKMLPPRNKWAEEAFTQAKDAVKQRYSIGSNKFSDALKIIEKHREIGQLIGLSFDLLHLTDDHAIFVIEQWLTTYTPPSGEVIDLFDYLENHWEEIEAASRARNEAITQITNALSLDEIADLKAIFYIGRDRIPVEYYEERLNAARAQPAHERPERLVALLVEKTSLAMFLTAGIEKLGRPDLAERIRVMCPEQAVVTSAVQ